MRVDMANRIELATTLFFVWKNSDPPPALLAGLGSVRVTLRLIDNKPSMVQIMGCRRAGDNPIIWTNDGTVYWRIYEIRPRWVKGRWPRRSFWRHIRFSDYIAIVFVFTVYCVLGTSLLLWIYAPIYSYYCPYKHYLLPMCFKCLNILLLYILCIYSFMYWKSGTSDLLVLMFFVL